MSVLIACKTIAFPTKVSKLRMYSMIPVGIMIAAGILLEDIAAFNVKLSTMDKLDCNLALLINSSS